MIEGEDYEVVDECAEEEDIFNPSQNPSAEVSINNMKNTETNKSSTDGLHENIQSVSLKQQPLSTDELRVRVDDVANKNDEKNMMIDSINKNNENDKPVKDANENNENNKSIDVAHNDAKNNIGSDTISDNAKNSILPEASRENIKDHISTDAPNEDIETNVIAEAAKNDIENIVLDDASNNNVKNNVSADTSNENVKNNISVEALINTTENNVPSTESKCPQKVHGCEQIDFTADISLDQLNEPKDLTDDDVLQHLDVIENIVLDPSTFESKENEQVLEKNIDPNPTVKKDVPQKPRNNQNPSTTQAATLANKTQPKKNQKSDNSNGTDWYDKKIAEKEAIIKERLSKVARVLGISYPCYEKWLEWEEKTTGYPVCKLRPARRCCLDKPYTNRWKFICSRKSVQESTKKTGDADTSLNKNVDTVWRLDATGHWGVNTDNDSEFPPFVLRAVKIFEDFLQTTEQQTLPTENFADDISMEIVESKKETANEGKQQWLWLLVRCNSMDELMLFATGKNISRATMDRLKQVYETGPGKDCNVKSLYCKSVNKCDDTTVTNTTFLVGSEALDEIVGGIKVQLAPKTNFWSNAAGAENVAKAVIDLLAPTVNTTVLEIGCGIGLIGLMMASKCQQVIGVDSPSEVEEAEMTCELNNIKNASFIMGSPNEVTSKITAALKNRKGSAIINANTNIGRAIEVMTCLRKIPSLKRIVMITTLTKQSVRAIMELARPVDRNHGNPFIPIVACVVDTLPVGPHFEAVILMQRRMIQKPHQPWNEKIGEENIDIKDFKDVQIKVEPLSPLSTSGNKEPQTKKIPQKLGVKVSPKNKKPTLIKRPVPPKGGEVFAPKNKFVKTKRPISPDNVEIPPKKVMKSFCKFGANKPWQTDFSVKKKKEWVPETPQLRVNPLYEKKLRENKEQVDLRERLSSNRIDTDIAQKVKEHQALLEIAKEKLSGPAPTVDATTAKQLQSMLNLVLEQTNKLQNQLPRSVWDRIAPPENANNPVIKEENKDDLLLKGRYVQEMGAQDILITAENKSFVNEVKKPAFKKYNNIPLVDPHIVPAGFVAVPNPRILPRSNIRKHNAQGSVWNRDKMFEKNRWNEAGNTRKPNSPMKRQNSPIKQRVSPSRRFSPKRPLLSPPRRPYSPPRRHFSPVNRPSSPFRQRSPMRRPMSPQNRYVSPQRRATPITISPSRRPMSSPRRNEIPPMGRPGSPIRRQISPRRPMSPMLMPMSPPRRQLSPMRRQISPSRRQQMHSPNRAMSPPRPEMVFAGMQAMSQEQRPHLSHMRREVSPQRFPFDRPVSPPRRQQSPPRRQMSPRGFADDWDIPSRGAVEQSASWSLLADRMPENVWRSEKPSMSSTNWQQQGNNERYETSNRDNWDIKDSSRDDSWNRGNNWNSKQTSTKPMSKNNWPQGDNRWPSASNTGPGPSNDNWNARGKETFTNREESWSENKKQNRWEPSNNMDTWNHGEKEDWNDLPEDARDPWGDDGNVDLKERWLKFDNAPSSSWTRDNEKGDTWSKPKDNWQNKSYAAKNQWQNNGNQQKLGESSRWISQAEMGKKTTSGNWQSGNNTIGSRQSQNFNFQTQRPFSTNQFKDMR